MQKSSETPYAVRLHCFFPWQTRVVPLISCYSYPFPLIFGCFLIFSFHKIKAAHQENRTSQYTRNEPDPRTIRAKAAKTCQQPAARQPDDPIGDDCEQKGNMYILIAAQSPQQRCINQIRNLHDNRIDQKTPQQILHCRIARIQSSDPVTALDQHRSQHRCKKE